MLVSSYWGGVSSAWATVTATLSGMNKVGDYYYPIYTLSESASISSYTSSNGEAPATITDGTTLTFRHRGTVTLSDNTVVEGKKYSATVYDFTSISQPGASLLGSGKKDGIWGFTNTKYSRAQIGSIAKGSSNTTAYTGLSISNTGSNALYLNFYYTNSTVRYGMQLNSSSGKVTVTDGAKIAKLDYYDNHDADKSSFTDGKYPTEDLTLSNYKQVDWATGDNPEFTLHERTDFYLYETLTTYTEVAESLTNVTATLTGFAKNGLYTYPVYTITATTDEGYAVVPTLSDGTSYTTSGNVLTYTTSTDAATEVTVTYNTLNTTINVPASTAYVELCYDLGSKDTYLSATSGKSNPVTGFSGSVTRYTLLDKNTAGTIITGISAEAAPYGWYVCDGKALQVNGASGKTYNLTISDATNGYAVLSYKVGNSGSTAIWDDVAEQSDAPVAATESTITLAIKDKNSFYYAYTALKVYLPSDNFIHTTYDLSQKATFPTHKIGSNTNGLISGFSDVTNKTRYTLSSNSGDNPVLYNITCENTQYSWILVEGYGMQFSDNDGIATLKVTSPVTGQIGILSYKIGDSNNETTWAEGTTYTDMALESNGTLSFTTYDKDGKHESGKAWVYTKLDLYTPVSAAKQSVTVNSSINMGTMVTLYDMDFSDNEGIKAYTATSTGENESAVVFTRINKVPAYTPVLIYKDGGATSDISFVNAGEADTPDASNMLKAGTGAAVATNPTSGTYNYILSKSSSEEVYGFFYANNVVVPVTKAYLQVTGVGASSRLSIIFDDQETTGIGRVESKTTKDATIYNLNGQRVNAPAKGLYIVNGKKIIIK